MSSFKDNRMVNFNDLRKSGVYSEELLNGLEVGRFQDMLVLLDDEQRSDLEFMEPLLYAVRNELETYKIFQYYGKKLQNNIELAHKVIEGEPELIKGTEISANKEFIENEVRTNPKVVQYMADSLKQDDEFVIKIILQNPETVSREFINGSENGYVNKLISKEETLSRYQDFMYVAILNDTNNLSNASKEIKNDSKFLENISLQKEEVIDYVIENTDEFGDEGIKGANKATKQIVVKEYMNAIDEIMQGEDERQVVKYKKVKDKVEEAGIEHTAVARYTTAQLAQSDNVTPQMAEKAIKDSVITMERIKRENKETSITSENLQALIIPGVLKKIVKKAGGYEKISDGLVEKLEEYTTFYNDFREMFIQNKKEGNSKGENGEEKEGNSKGENGEEKEGNSKGENGEENER